MKNITLFISIISISYSMNAQTPNIEWEKSYGGSGSDNAKSIQETSDGGYIVVGGCFSEDIDVNEYHGEGDFWILKLDTSGQIEWQKFLGGSNYEEANSIQQTADGGFIVAGCSSSIDGNVSGNHGQKDYWILKLNELGEIEWQKSLGGSNTDIAYAIHQIADDGYIVAGYSTSNDGDVTENKGLTDYWIVKLNELGGIEWQKSIGGSGSDIASSIQQTQDGGFIVAGNSSSNDGNVTNNHGEDDYWIVKLTESGEIEWQKSLGGSNSDSATSIQETLDNGFIVVGGSSSYDGDVTHNYAGLDYWIVKLNGSGEIEWQKSIGGYGVDIAEFVRQTNDEGYIVAGSSSSVNGDVSNNHGNLDYWIVKVDVAGEIEWQKSLGGSNYEIAYSIKQTNDGNYIIAGGSASNDGDVGVNYGYYDYWIVKLNGETAGTKDQDSNTLLIYPNPTKSRLNFLQIYRTLTYKIYQERFY